VRVVLLIYVVGVIAGLLLTDARPLARMTLALAWPVGPLAFIVTVTLLLIAALVIFPVFGAVVALGAAGAWWALT
jgi:hypothetical protein